MDGGPGMNDTPSNGKGNGWGKNSTKTHENRKFKLYHVFTTFLLENRTFYKLSTTFWGVS